jgi:3-isopropylmalate/(R)-2-methylmalate dehydratase large subunit
MMPGVMAKDVILHVIGEIGFDGATYRAMQWEGPGVYEMNMDDRMTIANMAIEAGGKNGIFPCDEKTVAYVEDRIRENGTRSDFHPVELDRDQQFIYDKTFDLSKLEPTVACHPDPGNRRLAKEMESVALDRAYIGSCTGGKTSDFMAFAEIVKGKSVKIDTFGVPATTNVVEELKAIQVDGQSVWDTLVGAGVRMTENASCAACLGGPVDTFGRLNTPMKCISATNRNFPGRMGNKESQVFLASPYTVAASALTGRITDPREFIG